MTRRGGDAHLGLLILDLSTPECASLKEKRRIVHGLLDALRHGRTLSAAEVGYQESRTRTQLAVACVGSDRAQVERLLNGALRLADEREGAVLNDWSLEWR